MKTIKTISFILLGFVAFRFLLMAEDLGGIGFLLIEKKNAKEPYQIEKVYPGSPADRAGIKAKSYLISIDGTNVVSMPTAQSARMLRGPVGAKVTVELADPAMRETRPMLRVPSPINRLY